MGAGMPDCRNLRFTIMSTLKSNYSNSWGLFSKVHWKPIIEYPFICTRGKQLYANLLSTRQKGTLDGHVKAL